MEEQSYDPVVPVKVENRRASERSCHGIHCREGLCLPCLGVSKLAAPEQYDLRTTRGEFRKAPPLESSAVLLVGRVFPLAVKERNWNLPTEAARQAVFQANWKDLPERRIEP